MQKTKKTEKSGSLLFSRLPDFFVVRMKKSKQAKRHCPFGANWRFAYSLVNNLEKRIAGYKSTLCLPASHSPLP